MIGRNQLLECHHLKSRLSRTGRSKHKQLNHKPPALARGLSAVWRGPEGRPFTCEWRSSFLGGITRVSLESACQGYRDIAVALGGEALHAAHDRAGADRAQAAYDRVRLQAASLVHLAADRRLGGDAGS